MEARVKAATKPSRSGTKKADAHRWFWDALDAYLAAHDLRIPVWTADDIGASPDRIGLAGSPTRVHNLHHVVLESTESRTVEPNPEAIAAMVAELVHEYILG